MLAIVYKRLYTFLNLTTEKVNKVELIKLLKENTTYDYSYNADCDQVEMNCKTFNEGWILCFQNGDMNGNYKGQGIFTNGGAESGLDDLLDILRNRDEFKDFIENEGVSALEDLIHEFCCTISDDENIDSYFEGE